MNGSSQPLSLQLRETGQEPTCLLVRNRSGRPAAVAGEVGKGRVVLAGSYYHPHFDAAAGTEARLAEGSCAGWPQAVPAAADPTAASG